MQVKNMLHFLLFILIQVQSLILPQSSLGNGLMCSIRNKLITYLSVIAIIRSISSNGVYE